MQIREPGTNSFARVEVGACYTCLLTSTLHCISLKLSLVFAGKVSTQNSVYELKETTNYFIIAPVTYLKKVSDPFRKVYKSLFLFNYKSFQNSFKNLAYHSIRSHYFLSLITYNTSIA